MKHYKENITLTSHVNFKLLDVNNKDITHGVSYPFGYEDGYNCFAEITGGTINSNVKSVLVLHPIKLVPYTEFSVNRWLRHLNGLGFKNYYQGIKDDKFEILVKLEDFTWKAHLSATLMLIRVLWEVNMAVIPDAYFQVLDENPKADRFEEIQNAHKSVPQNFNINHTVTFRRNGENVTLDTLMKKFKASKIKIYDRGNPGQSQHWNNDIKVMEAEVA